MPFDPRAGAGSIRDPRDPKQEKGRMVNPPRYQVLGGLSGPSKMKKNAEKVDKPLKYASGVKP